MNNADAKKAWREECVPPKNTQDRSSVFIAKNRCKAQQNMIKMKSTQKLVDSPAKDFGYVFCVLFLRRIPAHKEKRLIVLSISRLVVFVIEFLEKFTEIKTG